ncbi:MAG: hypothetical protein IIC82_00210 [Chloroflexi bacterium]|nr:hypothetical protein [Chloroflexota bacterium]
MAKKDWAQYLTDPRYRKQHFLIISAALVIHLCFHYATYIPVLRDPLGDLPYFRLHVLHEAEFLLIIVYAAMVFKAKGGLLAVAITGATSIPFILTPYIFGFEPKPDQIRDLAIQVGFILLMGVIMVLLYEMVDRERTRRIRLAEELAEVAQQANQAKTDFLATVSHELRTPMTGIIGTMSLMSDTPLTEEQQEYIEMIQTSSDSLLSVINDVLDFSKIEARELEIEASEFRLRALIESTIEAMSAPARKKGLIFDCEVADHVPDELVGDQGRLKQILMNLIGNAIKFTDSGKISVSVDGRFDPDKEATLHFAVADTGVGIPKDKIHVIFERFVQVESYMTRKVGGTGLGLAIVAQLVQAMGGEVWVDSVEGKGSTFSFTVKLKTAPVVAALPHA